MTISIETQRAYEVMSHYAQYAAQLLEDNKKLSARYQEMEELLSQLVQELGAAAIVHPNPIVREIAQKISYSVPEDVLP